MIIFTAIATNCNKRSDLTGGIKSMLALYLTMIDTPEDKNKFEQLYMKYRRLMFYIANQILKDEYLAEDAVHSTFLKLIDNLDKIDEVDCHKTKSFIVIMVRNHSINMYNQRKRRKLIPFEGLEAIYSVNDDIDISELGTIEGAILKLPDIYRDVMILKYVHELSNTEIALQLDITEATIRKRLERARIKIKEILKVEGLDFD